MKKNGAIWVVLIVLAAAALLMYFVVLPQVRGSKTVDEVAKNAGETVKQATDTAQKTIEQAADTSGKTVDAAKNTVADAAEDPKAGLLQKMARVKADGEAATVEFEKLLSGDKQPTTEQLAVVRAKLEAALKSASEVTVPAGLDARTASVVSQTSEAARKALAVVEAMPAEVAGARKAFDGVKSTMTAMLSDWETLNDGEQPAKPDIAKAEDAKPADATDAALPSFDVVRVEKDGSTVIAGKASPGAKIDVLDGATVIASTTAGDAGDFVVVLDNPLPAGDHQLVLRAAGKDGRTLASQEVATVSVPADKSGDLLAMVTKPGEASRIMEMPEARKDTAAAQDAAENDMAGSQKDAAGKQLEIAAADEAKSGQDRIETPALPDASADAANTAPAVEQDTADTDNAGRSDVATANDTAAKDAAEGKIVPADAKPIDKAAAAPEVLVSAVEIEGDKIFVAGSARPRSIVRVYADEKLVAEVSTDENGRFVADNSLPLAVGDHVIRADVLSADGKRVEFRASVPFFRPEGTQLAAVASDNDAADSKEMQPLADGAYDKAREEAGKAIGLLKGLYNAGRTPTLDELAAARSATEIALKTLSQIKLADNDDPVAKQMADNTAGKAAKALALLKSLPQDANAVKTALNSIDDAVTSAVAPSMETAAAAATEKEQAAGDTGKPANAEVASAKSNDVQASAEKTGKAADSKSSTASERTSQTLPRQGTEVASADKTQPKVIEQAPLKPSQSSVIIRRGDTLWQISRRVYGRGVRYTTIYVANEDQITNPDRIMPGQIFGVPNKYLPNSEELHRERMDHKKH